MNIQAITIVKGNGADHIFLHTDMPEASYPYDGELTVKFSAAKGSGQQYCVENFPGIQIKVVG